MCIDPFKGAIYAPTGYKEPPNAGDAPETTLKLRWAHGFRTFDT